MPRCPSCFTPLTRVEEDNIKSAICGNCFGTWINSQSLLRRTRLDASEKTNPPQDDSSSPSDPVSLSDLAEVVQASNSKEMLRCAQCEKPMIKERFHPMIPVEVDRCRPCGYIWLDAGETQLLRRLYFELLTSDDPEIQRRRDKIAGLAVQWQDRRDSILDAQESLRPQIRHGSPTGEDVFDFLSYLIRSV